VTTECAARAQRAPFRSERGTTLIETTIAVSMLLVVMAGLMGVVGMATSITENEGHLSARTAEYAVDKMEQLLQLAYGDAVSNTTVFPSVGSGGTGLDCGEDPTTHLCATGKGSSDPAAPVVGYTDYLDQNGNVLCTVATPCTATPPASWYYERVWKIDTASASLKRIIVTVTIKTSVARAFRATSTVMSMKTNCPNQC